MTRHNEIFYRTRSIWKMLGPFATAWMRAAARRLFYIAIHQVSLLSHAATVARRLRVDVHNNIDDNDNNDNAWLRDRYGPMEWAQLWSTYCTSQEQSALLCCSGYFRHCRPTCSRRVLTNIQIWELKTSLNKPIDVKLELIGLLKDINTSDDAATSCKNCWDNVSYFVYLRMVIGRKSTYDLHSSRWHFQTPWTIEMSLACSKRRWYAYTSHIIFCGILSVTADSTVYSRHLSLHCLLYCPGRNRKWNTGSSEEGYFPFDFCLQWVSEWVSSFSTAHQHIISYSVQ